MGKFLYPNNCEIELDGGEKMGKMEERLKGMENLCSIDCPTMYEFLTGQQRVGGTTRGEYEGAVLDVDLSSWSNVNNVLAMVQRFRAWVNIGSPHHSYYEKDFEAIEKAIESGDVQELAKALQSLVDTIYLE